MIDKNEVKQIWSKLIMDLDSDDIVLELKITNTTIDDYNTLLKHLNKKLDFPIEYLFGGKKKPLIKSITEESFKQDFSREIQINLGKIIVTNTFFVFDEIEFFTDSVLKLKYEDTCNLFLFIEWLGKKINKDVCIHIESQSKPSMCYNPQNNVFKTYHYSSTGTSLLHND